MIEPLRALLGAVLPFVSAYSIGRMIPGAAVMPGIIRLALGLSVLQFVLFCLMALGVAKPVVVLGVCGLLTLALIRHRRPEWKIPSLGPDLIPALVIAAFAFLYGGSALMPELETDALNYHLQPAIDATKYGGFKPEISFYERFPLATELIYIPAYVIGGSRATRVAHLGFLAATLPLMLHLAKLLSIPSPAAWVACALYFCSPVAAASGTNTLNDASLVFFCVAAAWSALHYWESPSLTSAAAAGVLAGACYAVKMTGGIAIPFVVAVLAAKRRSFVHLGACAAGASAMAGPWLLRNWIQVGNPGAPFLNAAFPNPHFYFYIEQLLSDRLRTYGVPFQSRFRELATGPGLQGAIGPVFLLAPVALLGIRRRPVRILAACALVFSAPWWLNAGARFFLPVLPFAALAMTAVLPRWASMALLVAHAALSSPPGVKLLAPDNWHLRNFEWRTAAGLERSDEYLERVSSEYRLARLVESNTPAEARILDLYGIYRSFLDRRLLGPWQSAEGHRAVLALELTRDLNRHTLYQAAANFPEQLVSSIVIRQTADRVSSWSLTEMSLWNRWTPVPSRSGWHGQASVNKWDVPLMFDRNVVSRWSTWRNAEPSDFVRFELDPPEKITKLLWLCPSSELKAEMTVELNSPSGPTSTATVIKGPAPQLNLRAQAMSYLRSIGISYIVAPASNRGLGVLGREIAYHPKAWGVEEVTEYGSVFLMRIKENVVPEP
ncbi:MAG TPA: glycosyltransferase family 39 protein [Bryobacteraceae bacterium]|nr:glycosyltransferase family 39 protein [Bryobacteraceae bacterium]